MKNLINGINQILAEWDPLDVGDDVSLDEYQGYVPQVIKNITNKEALTNCLENILINNLEVGYDKKDGRHKKIITDIVEKIIRLNKLQSPV